jgi:acyl carrier protein
VPTTTDVERTVRAILAEAFPDDDIDTINSAQTLREALDLDSLTMMDVVLELEQRSGIKIPNEDIDRLDSIDAVVEYVSARSEPR